MTEDAFQLTLNSDQTLTAREAPSQRVLEIVVQAPRGAAHDTRPPLNLALVLDRSGSMAGEKLDAVRQAALHVLDLLEEPDRAALVVYDDQVDLLAHGTQMTQAARAEMRESLRRLSPGGMTNLSGGWLTGCQEVASGAQADTLNRVLLLTDGLANQGITDPEALARHARELGARGVSTSTFGVGEGFNEHLLEAMSNQGGGNFYYIETPGEIPGLFLREFKELTAITAREVEVEIELPLQVDAQVLGGWRTEREGNQLRIFLGSLYSGRRQEIFVKLLTPPENGASQLTLRARAFAKGEDGQVLEDRAELTFHYAAQAECEAAPHDRDLLERFARVDLADTATEALKLERRGERERAQRLMNGSLLANMPAAAPEDLKTYQRLSEDLLDGLDEGARKAMHYRSYNTKRQREE